MLLRLVVACALVLPMCASGETSLNPSSGATRAVFADAATLRNWCLGRGAVRATCLGYLTGVTDTLREPAIRSSLAGSDEGMSLCLPAKLAGEQVRLIFLNHVHEHPDASGRAAAGQVHAALHGAFGCAPPAEPRPAPRQPPGPGPGGRISLLRGH